MIKCHLSRLLGERKLKISDVARDTGENRGTLTRLYHETAERVELETLNVLCRYLGCGVSVLLEYLTAATADVAVRAVQGTGTSCSSRSFRPSFHNGRDR